VRSSGSAPSTAAILDRLSAPAAVVDAAGTVEFVNSAWLAFGAANGRPDASADVGQPYRVWETADDPDAQAAAIGVGDVIDGRSALFSLVYPCHSPDEQRWFEFIVVPLERRAPRRVLSIHMPIGADTTERLRRTAGATSHRLTGLVMVCAWCAKELSLSGDWVAHEPADHRSSSISHGICPDCATTFR